MDKQLKRVKREWRTATLHSYFGEVINLGPFSKRDAERFMKLWSTVNTEKGDWWVSVAHTDTKPGKLKYRMIVSHNLEMLVLPVTDVTFTGMVHAYNMKYVAQKDLLIPNYWEVGGNAVTIHKLGRELADMKRRHFNLISHSCGEMDLNKL